MILRAEHLIKKYKSRTVVKDVSVQVEQGEIVGLLGPNGAGKTTSFYMTTGLIVPNEGHIYLNDMDILNATVFNGLLIHIHFGICNELLPICVRNTVMAKMPIHKGGIIAL